MFKEDFSAEFLQNPIMNPFHFLIFFLSATLLQPTVPSSSTSTSLNANCEKVANLVPSTAGEIYSFCLTSLQALPGSQSADERRLAIIACQLTKANYTHNRNLSFELLARREKSDPFRRALEGCAARYGAGVEHLQRGIKSIESGELNRALVSLHEAWRGAVACDEDLEGVNGGDEGVLMEKENSDALGIVDIAIKLTLLLKL